MRVRGVAGGEVSFAGMMGIMIATDAEFETPDVPSAEGRWARWATDFEAFIGMVVACLVGVIGVGVTGFIYVVWEWAYGAFHIPLGERVALTAGWALVTGCEIASVRWIGTMWPLMSYPRPVWLAMSQARRGWVASLAVAAWWLAHAVLILVVAEWFVAEYRFFNPTTAEVAVAYASKFGLLFGGAYASTVFVLLGAGAIGMGPRALMLLWRWRVPLDLLVTVGLWVWGWR